MVFDMETQIDNVNGESLPLRNSSGKFGRSISTNTNSEYVSLHSFSNSVISRGRSYRINLDLDTLYQEEDSDDSNYIDCGTSPSPDNTMGFFNESFQFSSASQYSIPLTQEKIRKSLEDQMKLCSGNFSLFEDIETKKIVQENLEENFKNVNKTELNICFLWAAFLERWDLLEEFLKLGAKLEHFEPNQGLSAIHLTAFSGCIAGTQFLIAQGSDVNAIHKFYSPLHCAVFGDNAETAIVLLHHGAQIQTVTKSPIYANESALHCAVRVNSVECVRLLTAEGADLGQVELTGMSPVHLAAEMDHAECLAIMIKTPGVNVNAKTKVNNYSPMHLAAEAGAIGCIEVLLESNADINILNDRNETPLHLAVKAQNTDSVRILLSGWADPNLTDCNKMTPLHLAASKQNCEIIDLLIRGGADVNIKGQHGYTPLHIAAMNELTRCVKLLINHSADVTAKSDRGTTALGIIRKKTPAALETINTKLDQSISFSNHSGYSKEIEVTLDFRMILQHCHPKEICFLNTFVDEGQKEILLHPLCSAFLYIKWKKIRKYYIARILFALVFVLSLSLYVLTALAHNCYNRGKNMDEDDEDNVIELCEKKSMLGDMLRNNPFVIEMQWFGLVVITACEILRKVYGLSGCKSFKQYMLYSENIIEWFVIVSVFVISFVYTGRTYTWQNHVGAFAVLFGWTNLMLMIGQLPLFGPYVAMYTRVQGEFAKLLLAYSCILIGFAISFCVIFPDSNTFANPFIGFITVITMMIGELNLEILVDDDPEDPPLVLEISAQVTFVLFLLFVTIILMNLLVGIAVNDIEGLQKTAGLSKLVRQTKLISYIELALFDGYLTRYLMNILHWSLVSNKSSKVAINVKPLNPSENRLPKDILEAAYEIAMKRKAGSQADDQETDEGKDEQQNSTELLAMSRKIDENTKKIETLMGDMQVVREILERLNNREVLMEELLATSIANINYGEFK